MKKKLLVIGMALILALSMVACDKGNSKQEKKTETVKEDTKAKEEAEKEEQYNALLSEMNGYLEEGDVFSAKSSFSEAISLLPKQNQAYIDMLKYFGGKGDKKNVESVLNSISQNLSSKNISEELQTLIDTEKGKDWHVYKIISDDFSGELFEFTVTYDEKGRVTSLPFRLSDTRRMSNMESCISITYTYLEDEENTISESYVANWNENYVETAQSEVHLNSDGSLDEYRHFNNMNNEWRMWEKEKYMNNGENIKDSHGNSTCSFVGDIKNTYSTTKGLLMQRTEMTSALGYMGVQVRNGGVHQIDRYVYVYCNDSDLCGDLSGFPTYDYDAYVAEQMEASKDAN